MSADIQLTEYGHASSRLLCDKLSNLCVDKLGVQTGPFGTQLHNEDYVASGTPIITVEHLSDNRISHINTPFVSDEDKVRLSKYQLKEGDIVFSRVGSVDRRALVRKNENGWLFSGRCLRVRVNKLKIDPVYLSYFFGLEGFKKYIRSIAVGATMPSINTKILSELPIYYPESLDEQRLIAKKLYSLDEKIELNHRINQTLEQIAQAIFKSWFVDFEPTRAKVIVKQKGGDEEIQSLAAQAILCGAITLADIDALSNESSSLQSALSNLIHAKLMAKNTNKSSHNWLPEQVIVIADLFPNALVNSELGEIPKGWDCSTLGKHFNVVMGQSPKGDTYNEDGNGMLFFQGRRDFGFRYPSPRVYTTEPKRIAKAGDTLISVRAPVGDRNMAHQDCCLGRGVAGIRHKSGSRSFTYAFIGHIEKNLSDNGSDGTVFSSINKNELHRIGFIAPTAALITNYELITAYIDDLIEVKENQIQSLIILRDTLLPKLLSGELSVETEQLDELQNDRVSA